MVSKIVKNLPNTIPFVAPEAIERKKNIAFKARLGANECNFAPSPAVYDALKKTPENLFYYPDPEAYELRHALSTHLNVAFENILIGSGIDGLLGDVARVFLNPEDNVVTSLGGYPTFNYHVEAVGGLIHSVPLKRRP